MNVTRSYVAMLCTLLLLSPAGGFAGNDGKPGNAPNGLDRDNPQPVESQPHGIFGRAADPYRYKPVPPPLQVQTTVAAIMELYWQLVAFNENGRVARRLPPGGYTTTTGRLWKWGRRPSRSPARRTNSRRRAAVHHREPDKRSQPLDRGGPHHYHGPVHDPGCGADHADPGSDRHGSSIASRTGAEPHPDSGASQIFQRHFPNYAAGFNLNIPIRNRAAQAQDQRRS